MTVSERRASDTGDHELFVSHLSLIDEVLSIVIRRHRLSSADAEDFRSIVRLKLIESDCAVLRKFRQESNVKTYLAVVISRFYLDYRTSSWGKWRPSAEARRAGALGILLERLIGRDGLSYQEACETLRITHKVSVNQHELDHLYARLSPRSARRMTPESSLEDLPADVNIERRAELNEASGERQRLAQALQTLIGHLSVEDQLILRLRFEQGLPVAGIARASGMEQRPIYTRLANLLRTIRNSLEQQGFARSNVLAWLGDAESELPVAFGDRADSRLRPSTVTTRRDGRKVADRE